MSEDEKSTLLETLGNVRQASHGLGLAAVEKHTLLWN